MDERAQKSVQTGRERGELGATATEYGLVVGFIAMVVAFGIGAFGTALSSYWMGLATSLAGVL